MRAGCGQTDPVCAAVGAPLVHLLAEPCDYSFELRVRRRLCLQLACKRLAHLYPRECRGSHAGATTRCDEALSPDWSQREAGVQRRCCTCFKNSAPSFT